MAKAASRRTACELRGDLDRVLTPRQLLEAYIAIVDGPIRAHKANSLVADAFSGRIFSGNHEPNFYRLLGWLIACGRVCCRQSFNKKWDDVYYHGGGGYFAGRHQFCVALFQTVDEQGSITEEADLRRHRDTEDRFQRAIAVLARAYADSRNTGSSPVLSYVSDVLNSVASGASKISSDRVVTPEFTKSVAARISSSRDPFVARASIRH